MGSLDRQEHLDLPPFEALVVGLYHFMPEVKEHGRLAFVKPGMSLLLQQAWGYFEPYMGDGLTHDEVLRLWHRRVSAWWPFPEEEPEHFYTGWPLCLDDELSNEAESLVFRVQARVYRKQLYVMQDWISELMQDQRPASPSEAYAINLKILETMG